MTRIADQKHVLGKCNLQQAIMRDQHSHLALIIATTLEDFILIVVKGCDLILHHTHQKLSCKERT